MRDTDTTGARLLRASQRQAQAWVTFREHKGAHPATRFVDYKGCGVGIATRYYGDIGNGTQCAWWELRLNWGVLTPEAHERLRGARFRTQKQAAVWVRLNIKPMGDWT